MLVFEKIILVSYLIGLLIFVLIGLYLKPKDESFVETIERRFIEHFDALVHAWPLQEFKLDLDRPSQPTHELISQAKPVIEAVFQIQSEQVLKGEFVGRKRRQFENQITSKETLQRAFNLLMDPNARSYNASEAELRTKAVIVFSGAMAVAKKYQKSAIDQAVETILSDERNFFGEDALLKTQLLKERATLFSVLRVTSREASARVEAAAKLNELKELYASVRNRRDR